MGFALLAAVWQMGSYPQAGIGIALGECNRTQCTAEERNSKHAACCQQYITVSEQILSWHLVVFFLRYHQAATTDASLACLVQSRRRP